jgi:peptidyl-Lys metalloendopeptidase
VRCIHRSVEYVESAIEDLADDPESNDYEQWFGRWTETRYDRVLSAFERIGDDAENATYDGGCDKEYIAEVDPANTNYIWLCEAFWDLSPTGGYSMASVIVHEESHFIANGGTDDYEYGVDKCEKLAEEHPDRAVRNADSYMFFADDVR